MVRFQKTLIFPIDFNDFIEFGPAQIYGRLDAKSLFWSPNVCNGGNGGNGNGGESEVSLYNN